MGLDGLWNGDDNFTTSSNTVLLDLFFLFSFFPSFGCLLIVLFFTLLLLRVFFSLRRLIISFV